MNSFLFVGYHSHFASYPWSSLRMRCLRFVSRGVRFVSVVFASYPWSPLRIRALRFVFVQLKNLQPYVRATVRMHSNAVSSTDARSDENSHKNNRQQQIMVLYKPFLLRIRQPGTCESAFINNRFLY